MFSSCFSSAVALPASACSLLVAKHITAVIGSRCVYSTGEACCCPGSLCLLGCLLAACGSVILQAVPESLLMLHGAGAGDANSGDASLFLHVGLSNGVLQRTEVDRITGRLTDTRQRFLGTRPPRLFAVNVRGNRSLLALSSRPWLGYADMGRWQFMPLSYEALDHAAVSVKWILFSAAAAVHEGCICRLAYACKLCLDHNNCCLRYCFACMAYN